MNFQERIELTLLQPGRTFAPGAALVYVRDPGATPIPPSGSSEEDAAHREAVWQGRASMIAPAFRRLFASVRGCTLGPCRLDGSEGYPEWREG